MQTKLWKQIHATIQAKLALPLALAVFLTACQPKPEESPSVSNSPTPAPTVTETPPPPPQPMTFALPYSPNGGFHPITGTNHTNLTFAPLLYQGLFVLDQQFQAQNALCQSYSVSEDNLTWAFQLTSATFSDGSPLTSAEVAASLEQARQSVLYEGRLRDIAQVTANGDSVLIQLSAPNGALPSLLDIPIVKETEDPMRPLGTGTYFLSERDGSLFLTARSGATVPMTEIPLQSIGASDDLVYSFDAQEVSLVATDLTSADALGYSGRFATTDYPTTTLLYMGFNTRRGACASAQVRRALSYVFDRDITANKLLASHAVAAVLPVHPSMAEYHTQLAETLSMNLDMAQALLTADGWIASENGKRRQGRTSLTLSLAVNQDNTYKIAIAETLATALEGLGCTVEVNKLPWDAFVKALDKGNFDLYLGETTLTADFNLEALIARRGSLNYGSYNNADLEELHSAYQAARTGPERNAAALTFFEQFAQEMPIAPLCFKNGSLLTQWGQVSGAQPTQRNVFWGLENWNISIFNGTS